MQNLKRGAGLLVIGLIFVVIGIFQLSDSSVKCGGQTQRSDQVCVSKGETRSLSEQRAANRSTGLWVLGLGSVLLVAGGVAAVRGGSQRAARPNVAQWQPQYPAQPQYPHQQYSPGSYPQQPGNQWGNTGPQQPPTWR